MPRKRLIRTHQFCYHIHSRSNNKEWFYIPPADTWQYFIKHLKTGKVRFNIEIHCFVLMSNHYHLLLRTPDENIDRFMQFFNQSLGKSISSQANRINRIFGSPYKWSIINDQKYYDSVYRYILQNPIRKNMTKAIEEYPYSSQFNKEFHELVDYNKILTPLHSNYDWLNNLFSYEVNSSIQHGLTRTFFCPKTDRKDWKRSYII
ncbi:MAG: hypothetical protein Fur0010_15300 [Bdellovibrio sp.]